MLHVKTVEKWCYALAYRSRVAERLLSVDRVMNAFVEHAERHVRKSTLRLRMKVTQEMAFITNYQCRWPPKPGVAAVMGTGCISR